MKIELYPGPFPQIGYDLYYTNLYSSNNNHIRIDLSSDVIKKKDVSKILTIWGIQTLSIDRIPSVLNNCYDILKPGGVLEIHVANPEAFLVLYSHFRDTGDYQRLKEVSRLFFESNNVFPLINRSMLSEELLIYMLKEQGFTNIQSFTGKRDDKYTFSFSWLTDEVKMFGKTCPSLSVIVEATK